MLAPLKNRAVLEREPAGPQTDLSYLTGPDRRYLEHLECENAALRLALRQSRRAERRNAGLSARKIVAQLNEINRLGEINAGLRQRLGEFESGQVVLELGRQLVELGECNKELCHAARHVWFLEKTLAAAHAECQRLSRERDELSMRAGSAG